MQLSAIPFSSRSYSSKQPYIHGTDLPAFFKQVGYEVGQPDFMDYFISLQLAATDLTRAAHTFVERKSFVTVEPKRPGETGRTIKSGFIANTPEPAIKQLVQNVATMLYKFGYLSEGSDNVSCAFTEATMDEAPTNLLRKSRHGPLLDEFGTHVRANPDNAMSSGFLKGRAGLRFSTTIKPNLHETAPLANKPFYIEHEFSVSPRRKIESKEDLGFIATLRSLYTGRSYAPKLARVVGSAVILRPAPPKAGPDACYFLPVRDIPSKKRR